MKIAVIGRTRFLIDAAEILLAKGHEIPLVWTCPAAGYEGANSHDFSSLAKKCGAEFRDDIRLNASENIARLREARCPLAISAHWQTILGPAVLNCFSLGILNAHSGDLPRYRGNAVANWAILNGENHVGLCIHLMAPTVDSGPVICRDRFSLGQDTYIGDVYQWINTRAPSLIAEAAEGLANQSITPQIQSTEQSVQLRCYPRRPDDGRIDWKQPADAIYKLIRASSRPFAGAFTTMEDSRRVTVWRADPFKHPGPYVAVPGQIMLRHEGDPVVACGDGCLRLSEINLDGESDARKILTRSLRARLI
jgi:methionyl-tRNA formyltransferase